MIEQLNKEILKKIEILKNTKTKNIKLILSKEELKHIELLLKEME